MIYTIHQIIKMNLADIIANLPKPADEIKKIKEEIQEFYNQIKQFDRKIILNENQIEMSIKFDTKTISELNQTNNLISTNMGIIKKITELYEKINGLYVGAKILKSNVNFNSDWIGGKVPGELLDTPDGYRIIFDGQSRSFKYKNIIKSTN